VREGLPDHPTDDLRYVRGVLGWALRVEDFSSGTVPAGRNCLFGKHHANVGFSLDGFGVYPINRSGPQDDWLMRTEDMGDGGRP
jgi:hypothetical protein